MNDMVSTVVAKSDQLNSDDLMGGAIVVRIRDTRVSESGEQRVSIFYDGDNNKPWKPCKSMCRVLVSAWGDDSKKYIGKFLTLYRDPDVTWAGMKTGGIRISHMTDIAGETTIPLTVTRGNKKPYIVKPMAAPAGAGPKPLTEQELMDLKRGGALKAKKGSLELREWWTNQGGVKQQQLGTAFLEEMKVIAHQADNPPIDNQA